MSCRRHPIELVQHGPQLAPRRRQPIQRRLELGPLPLHPPMILEDPTDDCGVDRADRGGTTAARRPRRRQRRGDLPPREHAGRPALFF